LDNINDILKNIKKVHMIGIGGSSMNGIATIIMNYGISVTGSDRGPSKATEKLEALGAKVFFGHAEENLPDDCDLVVYTLAISQDNPEFLKAKKLNIHTMERGSFLGYVAAQHQYSLAISGTHGKTTTTSMTAAILMAASKDPCVHLGGYFPMIEGSVRASTSPYFVTEACEYHKNLLNLSPYAGIILNIEAEHLDFYKGGLPEIMETFSEFAGKISPDGFLLVCKDNDCAVEASKAAKCKVITYSIENPEADFYCKNVDILPEGISHFTICKGDASLVDIELPVPGHHNISNALAASVAAMELGCTPLDVAHGLSVFHNTDRRFQVKGKMNGALLVDDYAHHPTEIKAVIHTANEMLEGTGKIWSIFQPHTYSRAKAFGDEFCEALRGSTKVIIADIYAAREPDPGDINSSMLADRFNSKGVPTIYISNFEEIKDYIRKNATEGDIVVTLGAGDINKVVAELAEESK